MKNDLKVSVIVPCYNSENTILRALNSISEQSYKAEEIIIIDDASVDRTRDIVNQWISNYAGSNVIKFICNDVNSGVSASRNIGISIASSELIAFLDSDDAWHVNKLECQVSFFYTDPQLYLSFHKSENLTSEDSISNISNISNVSNIKPKSRSLNKFEFLLKNIIPTRSVMMKNNRIFRFDESMSYSEDYDLWLRVFLNGKKIIKINLVLSYSFEDESHKGLSKQKAKMHQGVLATYRNIYNARLISKRLFLFLKFFQNFKYFLKRLTK